MSREQLEALLNDLENRKPSTIGRCMTAQVKGAKLEVHVVVEGRWVGMRKWWVWDNVVFHEREKLIQTILNADPEPL